MFLFRILAKIIYGKDYKRLQQLTDRNRRK